MYTVAVARSFVAQHFLVGGDWGAENLLHSHPYKVEVQLQGDTLDEHGYLVDIVDIDFQLDELVAYFRDRTLNGLAEFAGLNPSIEHFARIFCRKLRERLKAPNLQAIRITIWETDIAWASYHEDLG
ncbi:MAG: 6-carboxytetrahydropterin synthase [Deltaproteobacteria bacterium]|nr:MAG: 6-carboxytetrahydropterin synthase [Deltaproteobacteria bacterium]